MISKFYMIQTRITKILVFSIVSKKNRKRDKIRKICMQHFKMKIWLSILWSWWMRNRDNLNWRIQSSPKCHKIRIVSPLHTWSQKLMKRNLREEENRNKNLNKDKSSTNPNSPFKEPSVRVVDSPVVAHMPNTSWKPQLKTLCEMRTHVKCSLPERKMLKKTHYILVEPTRKLNQIRYLASKSQHRITRNS